MAFLQSQATPFDFLIEMGTEYLRLENSYPMFLYVIQSGDTGPVKIGYAQSPSQRLDSLQIGSPVELNLRAVVAVPGPGRLERLTHEMASFCHVRGEWFDLSPMEALEMVIKAANENGIRISPVDGAFENLAVKRPKPSRPIDEDRLAALRIKLGIG